MSPALAGPTRVVCVPAVPTLVSVTSSYLPPRSIPIFCPASRPAADVTGRLVLPALNRCLESVDTGMNMLVRGAASNAKASALGRSTRKSFALITVPVGRRAARTGAHPLRVISTSQPDRSTASSDELYSSMNCSLPRLISLILTAAALRTLIGLISVWPLKSAPTLTNRV